MTTLAETVFERFEVRKTKKQKAAFRAWASAFAEENGWSAHEEKGSFGAVNLVIGDPEKAGVVFTAHYDTCAVMPFPNFITPKAPLIYLLYQILISVLLLVPAFLAYVLLLRSAIPQIAYPVFLVLLWADLLLLIAGPANKHTANDNTSGTLTVLETLQAMPPQLRGQAAFILFDLEEAGLLGSSGYASKHKKAMKDKPVINFDCVSDGRDMLFAVRRKARPLADTLRECYADTEQVNAQVATKGYIYPSDQSSFPCGVGVAALKRGIGGILYMDRIHTPRDTVFREENIAFLVEGSIRLTERLRTQTEN